MTAIELMVKEIQDNTEWLETSEGDLVECVGIENLQSILSKYIGDKIIISQG